MEWKWTVEAIIALGALVLSIISLILSAITSYGANMLTHAQVEIQIREMISAAKGRYIDAACRITEKNCDKKILQPVLNTALEEVCNAYDEACMKYIDNKVDVKRFKKNYYTEIKNLLEDENTKDFYANIQTKYHATVKVYNEWNNLESK